MSSRTKPFDVEAVPGYPESLRIYKIPASVFWQVRLFHEGRMIRKSTKCTERLGARAFAKKFYDDVRVGSERTPKSKLGSFSAVCAKFVEWQEGQVALNNLTARWHKEDLLKLKSDLLPALGHLATDAIDSECIDRYLVALSARKLSPSTLKKHLNLTRKVIRFGVDRNLIQRMPIFPRVKEKDNPRPYFDKDSLLRTWGLADRYAKMGERKTFVSGNAPPRMYKFDQQFSDFVLFAANVFVRISDLKLLRRKHVKVERRGDNFYVEIFPVKSKTVNRSSVSLEHAVGPCIRILQMNEEEGYGSPEDFLLLPKFQNRTYALEVLSRMLDIVSRAAGTKYDQWGKPRTLYSLRHTALMNRILEGDKVDIFLLASNAHTSVEMLERFYLSHAESKARVAELQSRSGR